MKERTSLMTRSCVLMTLPSSNVCRVQSTSAVGCLTWIFSIARSRCVLMVSALDTTIQRILILWREDYGEKSRV